MFHYLVSLFIGMNMINNVSTDQYRINFAISEMLLKHGILSGISSRLAVAPGLNSHWERYDSDCSRW